MAVGLTRPSNASVPREKAVDQARHDDATKSLQDNRSPCHFV
jgi:hypothetical protein